MQPFPSRFSTDACNVTPNCQSLQLYADTEKLPQSIGYLIQHGIAHNYRGGIVTLTLSAEQHDTQSIGSFVLCVKDNGPGIPVCFAFSFASRNPLLCSKTS